MILNTTGNKINNDENSPENIPNNNVNIIFRNSSRKISEFKNVDKKIRKRKQLSINNFENENDRNVNIINGNEKTEEAKLNEEKIFEINENWVYITLNRLIYSNNCLVFYYINIVFGVVLLLISLVNLLCVEKKLSKILSL